jgi:enoyl-CoA hydratase/carnithine racemase
MAIPGSPGDQLVTCAIDEGVALLTLNRPQRHNAWSFALEEALFALLHSCAADPATRVIVITGTGGSFCPGMDTQAMTELAASGDAVDLLSRQPMSLPGSLPKPVIAAINGGCAGIGLVLALNCDVRFASRRAKFTTAFARRGVNAEHDVAWTLPRVVGLSAALDLLLSGRVVDGAEALTLRLIDRLYEPDQLLEQTLAYARTMASACSPLAMGVIKRQVYDAQECTREQARRESIRYWSEVIEGHSDRAEGISSYLEKRPPKFAAWDPSAVPGGDLTEGR